MFTKTLSLTVCVDKITFDPADEVTANFKPESCAFYIY